MLKVYLTRSQCHNMAEFINMYLLHAIRQDEGIDNLNWLRDMLDARDTLEQAVEDAEDE